MWYTVPMMKNHKHPKFNNFKNLKRFKPLPYPWYSEADVTKSGESAFKIRVPFYNNPFTEQPYKSWWIRGFKRAEKAWNEAIRFSIKVQETIEFEEVVE